MHRAPNHIQRQAAGLSDRRAKVSLGAVVALISLVVCVAAGVWYTNRGTTSKQSTAPEAKSSDSASDPATESKSGDPETDDTTPPGSALAEQPAEDRSVGEPNQSEQSVADAGNVNAEDSARESLEQEIMAGKWTTQRLLVLCSSRPYLLDFHTSLNGVSLEESEQLQLSDLAAELMAGPEIVPGQEVDDSPNMMTGSDAPSEEQDDAQDGDLPASNDSESPLSEDNVGEIEDLATGAPGSDAAPPAREDEDDRQMEWSELLDLPLVRSSWLGNLVAEDDSTDQLISMYDRQRDDVVAAEELREFLSRGLSRRPNLQMADDGYEDGALERSPWGPLDTNDDYVLQPGESSELVDRLAALDVDEDGFVNLAEATPPAAETMMSSGSMGLSPKTMLLVPTDDADPLQLRRDHSRLAARVIEHYTFLGQITAEQWPQMSDSEFGELDADSNQELDKSELRKLFEQPAHADIYVRFDAGDATQVHAVINRDGRVNQQQPGSQAGWVAAHEGGKLSLPGLALQIVIQDSFAANNKAMVLQTVGNALADDNLRESVTNQYQLGAEAFDVVDADSDGQLDANEQQRLWQWLRARQSSRMVGRWKLAAMPWFQLIDQNADRRLGMEEIREFSANFQTLFPGDEAVLGNSGPLLVSLEIQRRDPRLETIPQPTAMTDAPPELVAADWFEAMDSNADEAIELDEFIGDAADFAELDRDEDGFIRRNEVYTP